MKKIVSFGLGCLLLLAAHTSNAWDKSGHVYCDVNNNCKIDTNDIPVPSVLVVVINTSQTFSNSAWTDANGAFTIPLPPVADTYLDFIMPPTLPCGTVSVTPAINPFEITLTKVSCTNDFLIKNPKCIAKKCWLTGGGTIGPNRGLPVHTFGGVVYPGCNPAAAGGGNWNDIDHVNNLHFKGLQITVVNCGNVPGLPKGSKSPKTQVNFIEFQGTGTLIGIGGNTIDYGPVTFFARAEDLGEPGKGIDRYYLRVTDTSGNVVLLVSAAPQTPLVVAPVTIATGNMQIHTTGCK